MAFNGSGVFLVNSTGQPVVGNTTISSTVFNAFTADIATGLSTCITTDGQSTPTANISLGGFKLINLANGTASTDAVAFGQVSPATGTFTPTDSSGAGLSFTTPVGVYRKYAGFVTVWGSLTYPVTADATSAQIGSLPFTSANPTGPAEFVGQLVFTNGGGLPGSKTYYWAGVAKNGTTFIPRSQGATTLTNANLSTFGLEFTITYPI